MAEYIEREAALSFPFANGKYDRKNADLHFINGCESYREWIETIPAADVREVKHGKWLEYDDTEYFRAKCSLCGNWIDTRHGTNYCPNCGARMDGDGE